LVGASQGAEHNKASLRARGRENIAKTRKNKMSKSSLNIDASFTSTQLASLVESSFDEARLMVGTVISDEVLEHTLRALKPGCKIMVEDVETRELGNSISTDLRIQGFEDIMCAKDPASGARFVVATKPNTLSLGASATISLPVGSTGSKWTMDSMDLADAELVDESTLLEDLPSTEAKDPMDCGTGAGTGGKKRACANCSCGLAEREALENASEGAAVDPVAKASSCGGCYKGDAFRCAGCPFLGKPAFEPGQERLILALDDDV